MIGTLIAILFALFALFVPGEGFGNWNTLTLTMAGLSSFLFLIAILLQTLAWLPLQKNEQNMTPRVVDMFRSDRTLRLINVWLFLFPLLSILAAFIGENSRWLDPKLVVAAWTVGLGVSFDALHHLFRKTLGYLDPFSSLQSQGHFATVSIQNDREMDFCDWIDAISETAIKGIMRDSPSIAVQALDLLQRLSKTYLDSAKSIGHHEERISFTLYHLFSHIELINRKAVDQHLEPVCSAVITDFGKIVLHAAKSDITLAAYPIHYLGNAASEAQAEQITDIGDKATRTLVEVGKNILSEIDVTYLELKEPYLTLISHMHEIAKESFKQDKSVSIALLTQPFKDLKELFSSEKMANHPDTPAILGGINQALSEFDALELVMKSLPPIPQTEEESEPAPPQQ